MQRTANCGRDGRNLQSSGYRGRAESPGETSVKAWIKETGISLCPASPPPLASGAGPPGAVVLTRNPPLADVTSTPARAPRANSRGHPRAALRRGESAKMPSLLSLLLGCGPEFAAAASLGLWQNASGDEASSASVFKRVTNAQPMSRSERDPARTRQARAARTPASFLFPRPSLLVPALSPRGGRALFVSRMHVPASGAPLALPSSPRTRVARPRCSCRKRQ